VHNPANRRSQCQADLSLSLRRASLVRALHVVNTHLIRALALLRCLCQAAIPETSFLVLATASAKTLSAQHADLKLCHVQPAGVFGRPTDGQEKKESGGAVTPPQGRLRAIRRFRRTEKLSYRALPLREGIIYYSYYVERWPYCEPNGACFCDSTQARPSSLSATPRNARPCE
jgi:hypothetical protein